MAGRIVLKVWLLTDLLCISCMLRMGYYARVDERTSFSHISGSTGSTIQKFGVLFLLDPETMSFTQAMSGGYLQVRKYNWAPFLSTYVSFRSFIAQKASYTDEIPYTR